MRPAQIRLSAAVTATLAVAVTGLLSLGGSAGASQTPTIPISPGPVVIPGVTSSPAPVVRATNRLAVELLGRLGGDGNATFSPYSIEAALAMVDQGAGGQTAIQIGHVLGDGVATDLGDANEVLRRSLTPATRQRRAPTLDVANTIWVQSGVGLKPTFTRALGTEFGVAPRSVDFADGPETARSSINEWVAAHTDNLIEDLFPAGTISAQTALVLANAIDLKARWATPFQPSQTAPASFFPPSGPAVQAPFMNHEGGLTVPYTEGSGFQAVELPYAGSDLSMLAVMPSAGTLPQFQRTLSVSRLATIVNALHPTDVNISMPRLKLSLHADLGAVLSGLGMPLAFSNEANFTGISSTVFLKIQSAQHAAVLKVDEAGTVAAAATGISLEPTSAALPPPTTVTLDHPFLLFLRDDSSGAILFAARVVNPLDS